jgi:LysM repeat protein
MAHAHRARRARQDETRSEIPVARLRARAVLAALLLGAMVTAAGADYVVQRGDSLNKIASQFGVSAREIAAANGLRDPNLILVGQSLTIPGTKPTTHQVVAGESLARIALKYGVTVAALAEANGIANPHLIRIGAELTIPPAGQGSSSPALNATAPAPTYTVKKGDSLASIAARHGTTVDALAAANGITNTAIIYAGTTLRLSGPSFVAQPAASPASHTVKPGDSLAAIATRYGVTVSSLVSANSISNPNRIIAGQVLAIPGGSSGWRCPVDGARYFNDWGFPRSGGRTHEGNDLFAPKGTPVYAPVSGTVTFLSGRIGGLQFWLKGDDGNTYIGTHLDTVGTPGYVVAGTQIGTVGNTGNAAGSSHHLHFEIHPNHGAAVNPYPTLQQHGC